MPLFQNNIGIVMKRSGAPKWTRVPENVFCLLRLKFVSIKILQHALKRPLLSQSEGVN
jgi:hypothetical protein